MPDPESVDPEPALTPEEEELRSSWELLRGAPVPLGPPAFPRNAGDFILGTSSGRILVRITAQGRVALGEGVSLDEASEEFWTNLALKRKGMEERLMGFDLIERMLFQLADADLAYERASARAHGEDATPHDEMMQELSRRSLETRVHGLIEFSRGLLRRPLRPEPMSTLTPREPQGDLPNDEQTGSQARE